MKKKFLSAILIIAMMLITILPVTTFASSNPSSWAVEEVSKAKNEGLVTDSIMVDYQANITREQFCEMVVRAYEKISGENAEVGNMYFSDTSNVEILKAANLGIVTGYGNNVFGANDSITREQIATMLVRMIDKAVSYANTNVYNDNHFSDKSNISDWALPSVNYAFDNGIIKGVGNNNIAPLSTTTCEQAIVMIYRIYYIYTDDTENISFEDVAFEYSVRRELGNILFSDKNKIYNGTITNNLLEKITELGLYNSPDGIKLESIIDIDKLPNLATIKISNEIDYIKDLSLISDKFTVFDDLGFEICVRMAVYNYSYTDGQWIYIGNLTEDMLLNITYVTATHLPTFIKIKSLEDLKLVPNITSLVLSDIENANCVEITDYSPIQNIYEWYMLHLPYLNIEDDHFLDNITVSKSILFPNSGYGNNYSFEDTGENYQYTHALAMYRTTQQKFNELKTLIDEPMSDYEKFKFIHDYIALNMEYDWAQYQAIEFDYDYHYEKTPGLLSDFFIRKKGVCADYSSVYSYLCSYFGLECWYIEGEANGGGHAWNIVNLDGDYYHVDVTWDDEDNNATVSYDYFLVSDEQMMNHTWDSDSEMSRWFNGYEKKSIPECVKNYRS